MAGMALKDEEYGRYVRINLPHARTVVSRIGRTLEALGAFAEEGTAGTIGLLGVLESIEHLVRGFDDDPPPEASIVAADAVAERARALVDAILSTPTRNDRLGQHVRNLFECLGLAEEGATLSLQCGERSDSPLR